ncbi:hypothetical protein N657DRAFT_691210 [Parathielavia appendiculata]|uniref:HIT-type domain-containing protein n=1 Tax=Parathielavia appendiculata TaxID=2587402 RepID=A0AAN6TXV5_9PEZI|nr:hypothetical protein N657DRAFT_691210 [Parathielavia appendiculata]
MSLRHSDSRNNDALPVAEGETSAQQSSMLGAASTETTAPHAADPASDATAIPDADPSSPPKKLEPKLCGVCGIQPGKYKCPRCSVPYCSVACSKQHKENHPPDPPKSDQTFAALNTAQNTPADDDPYSILLDHRNAFQRLFARYPSLAAELTRIQATTLPPAETPGSAFNIPGLGPFTANTGRNRQEPWTKDVGLRRGAEALRKARMDPSDTGDGVREFCELVRFLLSKKREGVERVREEVVAAETRVIERLLREEGGC